MATFNKLIFIKNSNNSCFQNKANFINIERIKPMPYFKLVDSFLHVEQQENNFGYHLLLSSNLCRNEGNNVVTFLTILLANEWK